MDRPLLVGIFASMPADRDRDEGVGLSAAFRDAAAAADSEGRLAAASVRALRARLEDSRDGGPLAGLRDPERLLGPFENLPPGVQRSLVRELEEDERWRLRGFELGGWHPAAVRMLRTRRYKRLAKGFTNTTVSLLRDGPRSAIYALHGATTRWKGRHASRPSFGSLLRGAGLDPRSLTVYYARGLAQPAGYRGFWHDAGRNVTIGSILGVDLLPAPDGFWYLESNLNPAIRQARTALYERDDPFVLNLCRFAQEGGYRRLVVVLTNNQAIDPVMAGRCETECAARKIRLTLLEDAYMRRSRYDQTFRVPEALESDTLVVRLKLYVSNLDTVFHSKQGTHRALEIYQERSGDRAVRLAPTSDDPEAGEYDPRRPFPNLVYKMPDRDRGTGIVFVKAPSGENARALVTREIERASPGKWTERLSERAARLFDDHHGVFQPYIVGSMLEGRRLYYVRSHVLLTPLGPQYLSAHRIVGSAPVPAELPDGIVQDRSPYFWKFVTGARFAVPSPEEESRAMQATLGVARGLSAAAEYGFRTRAAP